MKQTPTAAEANARGFQGSFRQSMSWLHTWAGLVLGVLLYFMFVTGTVGYFNREVDRWMQPEMPTLASEVPQAKMVELALNRLAQTTPSAKEWYVSLPATTGRGNPLLEVWSEPLPTADGKSVEGKSEYLDPRTGQKIAQARETGGGDALYRMHYSLHYIPYQVAIYIVGIATMFMLIAIVSGIVVHKKIFKDFFTFRPAKGQRSWLDAHNLSSVLALPYMVMITYSGLLFYTYEYMPSPKVVLYGTNESAKKQFEKDVYGERYAPPVLANVSAPLAPIAPMLAAAEAAWGPRSVGSVSIIYPGDANAKVRIDRSDVHAGLSRRSNDALLFAGSTGARLPLPNEEKMAAQAFSQAMFALHEGHFATPFLRWIYFLTGALGAAMVATGMVLWTTKRRQQLKAGEPAELGLRFVERLNVGTIVGLLIAIAVYFWANRLLPIGMADRAAWEMNALFIAWSACLIHSALRPTSRAWFEQFSLAALFYTLLPMLNAITTDKHFFSTLRAGDWVLASFDLTSFALGMLFALIALRQRRKHEERKRAEPDASNTARTVTSKVAV
jgi:uncharacterized iron-regulated membrane protein